MMGEHAGGLSTMPDTTKPSDMVCVMTSCVF